MNVDEMPAGQELDALVAKRVMGLPPEKWYPPCGLYHQTDDAEFDKGYGWSGWCYTCGTSIKDVPSLPPCYSTNIAAAWQVLEKMYAQTPHAKVLRIWKWDAFQDGRVHHRGPWACQYGEGHHFEYGDTAPLAISRAALRAIERLEKP